MERAAAAVVAAATTAAAAVAVPRAIQVTPVNRETSRDTFHRRRHRSRRNDSHRPLPFLLRLPFQFLLNVRSGPGLDYEVITTVPEGTRASIYGRDPLDDWFQVQIEGVDGMVWIYQDLTTVEGSLDGVRFLQQWEIDLIARPGDGPLAITTPDILNVRSGPGLDYDILTTVTKGTQATIIGIGAKQ